MLELNDVQKELMKQLRGVEEAASWHPSREEAQCLELMAQHSEDGEICKEIESILEHIDE